MGTLRITKESNNQIRRYEVEMLSYVTSNTLIDSNSNKNVTRPIWMCYAGPDREVRLFNSYFLNKTERALHDGHTSRRGRLFECLKTLGYRHYTQKHGDTAITTVYLPHLFHPNPGGRVESNNLQFAAVVNSQWLSQQKFDRNLIWNFIQSKNLKYKGYPLEDQHLDLLVSEALLFMTYLDRRTRFPMPTDTRFALQLYLRCLGGSGLRDTNVSRSHASENFVTWSGLRELNLTGMAFHCRQSIFATILSEEVKKWHS